MSLMDNPKNEEIIEQDRYETDSRRSSEGKYPI